MLFNVPAISAAAQMLRCFLTWVNSGKGMHDPQAAEHETHNRYPYIGK